jgi:hypothetical protein
MPDNETRRGGRPKLPENEVLSETVFVLLRSDERSLLDELARDPNGHKSRSAVMRTAFRYWLENGRPT